VSGTPPPGPNLPAVAQALAFLTAERRALAAAKRRYGGCFSARLPRVGDTVVVLDPDLVKQLYNGEPEALEAQHELSPIYGAASLLVADGGRHRMLRRTVAPLFGPAALEFGREALVVAVDRAVEQWPRGKTIALLPELRKITLEAILRYLFGLEGERLRAWQRRFAELLSLITSWQSTLRFLSGHPRALENWRRLQRQRDACRQLIDEEIRRRERETGASLPADAMAQFLDAAEREGVSEGPERQDQLLTLVIGGYDAPAITVAWAVERLIRHPDILERLREETAAGGGEEFAEAVVKETMRLRPPIPFAAHRARSKIRLGDYTVAPGTVVLPYLPLLHRDPEVFDNPSQFRPERFLRSDPPRYAWAPFGRGSHACIGSPFAYVEIKTILIALLTRAAPVPTRERAEPMARRAATVVPGHGCRVRLRHPIHDPVPAVSAVSR